MVHEGRKEKPRFHSNLMSEHTISIGDGPVEWVDCKRRFVFVSGPFRAEIEVNNTSEITYRDSGGCRGGEVQSRVLDWMQECVAWIREECGK